MVASMESENMSSCISEPRENGRSPPEPLNGHLSLPDLVSRYVSQLLKGCGHRECSESLCDTGRRNICEAPMRKYTPRSARAIAITIASSPKPEARLCRYLALPQSDAVNIGAAEEAEGQRREAKSPIDPSSFTQRLSTTAALQALANGFCATKSRDESLQTRTTKVGVEIRAKLKWWHAHLRKIRQDILAHPSDSLSHCAKVMKMAGELYPCLQSLLDLLPPVNIHQLDYATNLIEKNCSSPAWTEAGVDPACLQVMDFFESRLACDLFTGILKLISKMFDVHAKAIYEGMQHVSKDKRSAFLNDNVVKSSVGGILAASIYERSRKSSRGYRDCVVVPAWLKKTFLQNWNGEANMRSGTISSVCLAILASISSYCANVDDDVDWQRFCNIPAIATRLNAADLMKAWLESSSLDRSTNVLSYPFLFSFPQRAMYFRAMNHLRMRKAHSDAEKAALLRDKTSTRFLDLEPEGRLKYLSEHYLLLNVSRGNVLSDAFDQLWQRHSGELLRPLRVRLGEIDELEIGHDLGGVQIEFFNLLCRELFKESNHMFTTDPHTGMSWFRPASLASLYMFELCGVLFGLALYNGITLPISLPQAFYMHLLHEKCHELRTLKDAWPTVFRSLGVILREDVTGLDAVFPLEANGLRLSVNAHSHKQYQDGTALMEVVEATPISYHAYSRLGSQQGSPSHTAASVTPESVDINKLASAWPGWTLKRSDSEPREITPANKASYVAAYIDWLTFDSVAPQFSSFRRGFYEVIDRNTIGLLAPDQLSALLEGSSHLDVDELRRATVYEDYDPKSRYIQNFWRIVSSWTEPKQKALLKFVTAVERVPPGGAGNLTFKIQRATTGSESLPTSSTCFGTLLLPKYASTSILEKKFDIALEYGLEGFGSG